MCVSDQSCCRQLSNKRAVATYQRITGISGLVVKSNVAIVGPRVRFTADAKNTFWFQLEFSMVYFSALWILTKTINYPHYLSYGDSLVLDYRQSTVCRRGSPISAISISRNAFDLYHSSMDLVTKPSMEQRLQLLKQLGLVYQQICDDSRSDSTTNTNTNTTMIQYDAGTFVPTSKGSHEGDSSSSSSSSRTLSCGHSSRCGGRMIVDTMAAWARRGVHCANHSGMASDIVIGCLKLAAEQRQAQQQLQQQLLLHQRQSDDYIIRRVLESLWNITMIIFYY
jgi:hypothetical protein